MYDINHAYAPPKFTWNLKMMVSKARISTDSFSGEPSEVLGIVCLSSYVVTVVLFPVAHVYCLTNYLYNYIWQMNLCYMCGRLEGRCGT